MIRIVIVGLVAVGLSACGELNSCVDKPCAEGLRCSAIAKVCVVDEVPTIALEQVSSPVTAATLTIAAKAADDAAVLSVDFSGDDGATWTAGTLNASDGRATAEMMVPPLDAKPWLFRARVTDSAGHVVEASGSATVDRVAPRVTLKRPTGVVGGATTSVAVEVTDGSGEAASVKVARGAVEVVASPDMGLWVATVALPTNSTTDTAIVVTAKDTAGNAATAEFALQTNTTPPTFSLEPNQPAVSQAPTTVRFVADRAVTDVTAMWPSPPAPTVTVIDATHFSVVLTAPSNAASMVPLQVAGKDELGNQGSSQLSVQTNTSTATFTLDPGQIIGPTAKRVTFFSNVPVTLPTAIWNGGMKPVEVITSTTFAVTIGANPTSTATSAPLVLAGTAANGNTGGNTVMVTTDLTKPVYTVLAPQPALGPNPKTITFMSSKPLVMNPMATWRGMSPTVATVSPTAISVLLSADPNNLATSVPLDLTGGMDALGNVGGNVVMVTTDTTKPTMSLSPANQVVGPNPRNVTFSANRPVTVTTVLWRGQPGSALPTTQATNFTTSLSHTMLGITSSPLTVTAVDELGNVGTSSFDVPVDTVPPTVSITSPLSNAIFGGPDGGALAVSVTAADGTAPATSVAITFNNATRAGTASGNTWTASFPLPANLDYVAKTIDATATDALGNIGSTSVSVFVDNVRPQIVFNASSPTEGQRFNKSAVNGLSGVITTAFSATDGDAMLSGQRAIKTGTTFGTDSTIGVPGSVGITPASTANPLSYGVRIRVSDRAGNTSESIRNFDVDMVNPTVLTFTPTETLTVDPRLATVTFSEPMTATAAALATVPSSNIGTWVDNKTYQTSTLLGDTDFTVSVAAASDAFGNPVTQFPAQKTFRTAAAAPPNKSVIATGVSAFEAVSDINGQAFIAYLSGTTLTVLEVNAQTGALGAPLYTQNNFGTGDWGLALNSWTTFGPGSTKNHRISMAIQTGTSTRVDVWENGSNVVTNNTQAIHVVLPPTQDITLQSNTVGLIKAAGEYSRNSDKLTLPTAPLAVTSPFTNQWLAVSDIGQVNMSFFHVNQPCTGCAFQYEEGIASSSGELVFANNMFRNWIDRWRLSLAVSSLGQCMAVSYLRELKLISGLTYSSNACVDCQFIVNTNSGPAEVASYDDRILVAADQRGGTMELFFTGTTRATCATLTQVPNIAVPMENIKPTTTTGPRMYKPLRLGNRPALMYIDKTDQLTVEYE